MNIDAAPPDTPSNAAMRAAEELITKLGNVLGKLHVINGEANLLVNFSTDPHLDPKQRGLTIQEYRLVAHRLVCEVMDALKPAIITRYLGATPVAADWFDLALRYMRGDPTLTDVPYSEDSVFAEFLHFWDAQTPHFRSVVGSIFKAAPKFTTTPPSETAVGGEARDRDRCPVSGCDKEAPKDVPGPPRIPGPWYCLAHRHLKPQVY